MRGIFGRGVGGAVSTPSCRQSVPGISSLSDSSLMTFNLSGPMATQYKSPGETGLPADVMNLLILFPGRHRGESKYVYNSLTRG